MILARMILAAGLVLAAIACQPAKAPPAAPAHLSIGPGGAMGLTREQPLDVKVLAPAFPGLDLVASEDEVEGQRFPIVAVKSGDEIVYTVTALPDGRVHSVITRSPLVAGPKGEVIGETSFVDAPKAEVGYCGDEYFDGQPAFACSTAADGAFWRVYLKIISDGAPESAELAQMTPTAKDQSVLVEMRWIAPR